MKTLLIKGLFIISFISIKTVAQPLWFPKESKIDVGGYLKELPYLVFNGKSTEINNLIHFRSDIRWYPLIYLTFELGGRLQLYSGDAFGGGGTLDSIAALYGKDVGYADLTETWPTLLYGNIDRAWIGLETGNLNIMLGRQRINWGTNLIWNPNDWYNVFNFIDFDYEERPGTDAFHIQYYTSPLSVAEFAFEFGRDQEDRTFAAMYRFNVNGYDLQLQSGLFGLDAAIGFSWSGAIYGGGFRGEIAYFHQVFDSGLKNFIGDDSSGNFVGAISGDYIFPNSLYLHGEILYNGFGTNGEILAAQAFQQITAKNLLPSIFGIFAEVGYTFTPVVYGSLSLSTNPADFSFYIAPGVTWSFFQNIDLFAIAQLFFGEANTLYGETDDLLALRIRWSF